MKKTIITITGTWVKSHYSNWIECETTWVPKMREQGFEVIYLMSNPYLQDDYELIGNFFFAKCSDNLEKIYYKNHHFISKYILEKTDYEYRLHVDSDTFIHPHKINYFLEDHTEISPKDYVGCVTPYPGLNPNILNIFEISDPNLYASGGSGFLLSRNSMKIMVENFNENEYQDLSSCDKITGDILFRNGIKFWHDSRFLFDSPWKIKMENSGPTLIPFIGYDNSFLVSQHYCNGHMKAIMDLLKI